MKRAFFLLVLLCLAVIAPLVRAEQELGRQVTIYRDAWGVPHVYADTEEDGFYGLGYAQAEDRLEAILWLYLRRRGELASAFGPDSIESDFRHLQWRHLEEARAGFERLSPQLQKNYRYFIAGIQRYMDEHADEVPSWAPKLEPALIIANARASGWLYNYARDGLGDCTRGGVKLSASLEAELESRSRWPTGSNVWTLMPWRTADNVVIHHGDPHTLLEGTRGKFTGKLMAFEFRIDAGALKAAGFSNPGGALLHRGHTRNVAWGTTMGAPDVSDCYELELDPQNPRRYRYDGEWKTLITREVSVSVKGGSPVQHTFEYTEHNGVLSPVVAREEGKAYVVSTPYMHQAGLSDEECYRMSLAKDIGEFREAMKLLGMGPENIMAGDAHGNTFYVRTGRTPIRPSGFDWTKPVPGNTSKTAWKGIHPFEDLVQIENPPQGYMQNNNLAPDRMMEESPLTADRYPSYIFNDTPGRTRYRGIRAVELLSNTFSATVEDAVDIALDEKWVGTEAWQRALRRALNQNTDAVRAKPLAFRRFVQRILNFDGFARASSVAALNYYYWRTTLPDVSKLSKAQLEELTNAIATGEYWRTPLPSAAGLSEAQLEELTNAIEAGKELAPEQNRWLLERIERAIEAMIAAHGTTNRRCGDVFRVGRGGYSWPAGCGYFRPSKQSGPHALRILGFRPPDSIGQRWLFRGHRNATLTIFTDPIQSFTAAGFGQSDHPDSPHYSDQARLISERRFKPTYFYKEDLLKHVTSTKTLDVRIE